MFQLILDTSTEKSLIVFTKEKEILIESKLPAGLKSSKYLFEELYAGFSKLNKSPLDLDAIAVTIGPGSFTGIRVAAAAAKGLSFPKSTPLIELNSLSGFVSKNEGVFASIIDAKIFGAHFLLQERTNGCILERGGAKLITIGELQAMDASGMEIVGPSLEKFCLKNCNETYPDARHLLDLALSKYEKKQMGKELNLFYPGNL